MARRSGQRGGFALLEAAVAGAVLALVAVLLFVAAADGRRQSGMLGAEAGLQRLAAITSSYTADNAERYWGLSWKVGDTFSQWEDLNHASSDLEAHANQAVDIIRRRADPNFQRIQYWIADLSYSHLVLADYLDESLPMRLAASPADDQLRGWQDNFAAAPNTRLPFSSSYELPTSFYDRSDVPNRISSGGTHNTFLVPGGAVLGAWTTAEATYPSQKVQLYDRYQRHFGSRIGFFAYQEVRLPQLFADGSVDVRKTGLGNPGWQPNSPNSFQSTFYTYSPAAWEPPPLNGKQTESVNGYLRWTRAGIGGRDYGGPEPGLP